MNEVLLTSTILVGVFVFGVGFGFLLGIHANSKPPRDYQVKPPWEA